MQSLIIKLFLIVIFFIIYFKIFEFIWFYLPIESSIAILTGSLIVIVISLILATISANKLIVMIKHAN